ncbi:tripartite tricarboxylate transporter substrate binding protein [Clostridium sp. OM02-18AC]|uniref:tripartite tricarboxylate transporter substrate binding protein n=1 Tax=Clostridium sp. OM02-18AC TaxID=2292311 RepID=UPI000E5491A8|nr:tripartite tricarboxylate transporter substrate binding protein [Clostridium sp. OM02-18AC]RHV67476.1 tripartite tricarboxylate transporter substrate binding protein [Clostridium sp. OM02-18AC]
MKKQLLSVMLAGVMAMTALTGCGGSSSGSGLPKNIELQVPAKAGGGTDVVARAIATQVAKDSGSNLTVQNNTDGSGVVAMEKIRTAKPDASSLLFFHTTMLIKSATGVYDHNAVDDFTVIAVGEGTEKTGYALVVPGDSPYNTTDDLVEAAKAAPGSVLLGVETGGSSHIMSGLFAQAAGIEVKYVEAGSDTEKLTALVGGSITAAFVNQNQAKQYVESGKAKALACFSVDENGGESTILPGVTSLVDQGYDCTFSTLFLVLGPKDMKAETVTALHDYFESAVVNKDVQDVLKPAGFDMTFFSQEEGMKKLTAQRDSLNSVVEMLGLKQK